MSYMVYSVHDLKAVDRSFHIDFKLSMRLIDRTTVHKRSPIHKVFLNEETVSSPPFITIANSIDCEPPEPPIIFLGAGAVGRVVGSAC